MKNDDYKQWFDNYEKRVKQNVIYHEFDRNKDYSNYYYQWAKDYHSDKAYKASVKFEVSSSVLDRIETALARVDLALDKLLDYLHEKKNS